jgi:cobalt-zinc-cadmium efflux system protein
MAEDDPSRATAAGHHGRNPAGHAHGHPHAPHSHHHDGAAGTQRYALAIALNVGIVVVQIAAGLLLSSTALLADAGHNASDVVGLALALLAAWLATRRGSERRTYGFGKAGVLAALANSLLLVGACGVLAYEAVDRIFHPPPLAPPGGAVMLVAGLAVAINILSGWLLMGGSPSDVNRRAAVVHLMADAAVSGAVLVAGAIILATGARWVDPAASLLIVAVILWTTWRILVQSLDLALDAAPADVDIAAVRDWLATQPGVVQVHDLHIWPISATEMALTAHLVVPDGGSADLLLDVTAGLKARFRIDHPTIQVERTDCDQCAPGRGGP